MACRRKHSLTASLAGTGDAHSFIKELIAYVAEESPAVTIEQARLVPMAARAIAQSVHVPVGLRTLSAHSAVLASRMRTRTDRTAHPSVQLRT